MTDSQQNQQSEHLAVMRRMLHPELADAIDGRIREVSREEVNVLRTEVSELIANQRDIRERAQSLPQRERRQVQPEVDAASRETDAARQATNDLQARRDADEQIDPREVDQVRRQSEQAAAAQQRAAERVDSVSQTDDRPVDPRHDAIRRVVQTQDTQRETPGDYTLTGLGARVDQLEACQQELIVVSATSFASVRSSDDPTARRRVLTAAGVAALVAFVLYLLILLGSAKWDWNWAIGLPAIAAAVTGLVVWALTREPGPSAEAVASADAIVARWRDQGNDHPQQDDVDDDHVVPGMRQQPAHEAHAHAGASARTR